MIPFISQVITTKKGKMQEKMAFLRCPAQLCDFRSENLASYLERMCKLTESRLFFFKTSYGRFCIFWDRYFGRISRTAKKRTSFQFVGWCMINIVSNNHTQIRKIERGMVNLPPWQWLDWPSPHIYLYILSYTGQAPRALRRLYDCLLYTSPSPRDRQKSRMPSSA